MTGITAFLDPSKIYKWKSKNWKGMTVSLPAAGFSCLHMGFVLFCSPATVVCSPQTLEQKPLACSGGTNFKGTLWDGFLGWKVDNFFLTAPLNPEWGVGGILHMKATRQRNYTMQYWLCISRWRCVCTNENMLPPAPDSFKLLQG